MNKQKLEEVEIYETEFKTTKKYEKRGLFRLKYLMLNHQNKCALLVLQEICNKIDCNFYEVLDAINRTTR